MGLPGLEQVVDFGKQVGGMLRDFGAGAEQGLGLQKALGMTLGMAQPSQQQQPQGEGPEGLLNRPGASGPENLSDYHGLIPNLLLRIGNAGEELEGRTSVSDSIRGQRRAANDRQQEGIKQALELAREFGGVIDKTPQDRLSTVSGLLRKRYSEVAGPGGEHFYDALVGDGSNWFGNTEEAATDPTLHALIANPNSTPEMVKEYMKSEHFQQRRDQAQDAKLLAPARAKIDAQRTSANPAYRAAWEEAAKDGTVTLDDVIGFQPLLAEADRLTNTDIATLRRNESTLTDVPGMRMREEVIAKRAGDEAAGRAKTLQQQKDDAAMARQRVANEGLAERTRINANKPPTVRPASPTSEFVGARLLSQARLKYQQPVKTIDSLLNMQTTGIVDYAMLQTVIHNLDNTAAKQEEVNIARSATDLAGRLRAWISNKTEGTLLGPDARADLTEMLKQSREVYSGMEKELVRNEVSNFATSFGPDSPDRKIPGWRGMFTAEEQSQMLDPVGAAAQQPSSRAPQRPPAGAGGEGPGTQGAGSDEWKTDPRNLQLQRWLAAGQITKEQYDTQAEVLQAEYDRFNASDQAMEGGAGGGGGGPTEVMREDRKSGRRAVYDASTKQFIRWAE